MKTKLTLLAVGSSLLLAAPALLAQDNFAANNATNLAVNNASGSATNPATATFTNAQTLKYQIALEKDRTLGQRSLLPPGLKEKMKLTEAQRIELKSIENDFAKTSQEYKIANQPRIDAANEANRQARAAKDKAQIQAARTQLQQVWAGLQPYRDTAVVRIKPLLTPDQLNLLDDPKNQWRENHADEANDPSAN